MKPVIPGDKILHKKRGSTYTVVDYAIVQTDIPLKDMDAVIVYKHNDSGRMFVRPAKEFYDGRFEEIEDEVK